MLRDLMVVLGLFGLVLGSGPSPSTALAADPVLVAQAEHAEETTPADHSSEAHGSTPDILEPQPTLAFWTLIVFIGLLLVLGRFAWKPILEALHQRESHLEHVLLDAEKARNESEQLLVEHRRLMAQAAEQVQSLLADARRDAHATTEEILRKAQEESEATKKRAEHDIETARDQALDEIWTKAADLAVNVATKVLGRDLSEEDHRRLVTSAIQDLPDSPARSNGQRAHS